MAPKLRSLNIAVDYITDEFRTDAGPGALHGHPLETLELDDSGAGGFRLEGKITADLLFFAVSDGGLGNLRRVRVHKRLCWEATAQDLEDMEDLSVLLEAKAREDTVMDGGPASRTVIPAPEAGVWVFE